MIVLELTRPVPASYRISMTVCRISIILIVCKLTIHFAQCQQEVSFLVIITNGIIGEKVSSYWETVCRRVKRSL